MNRHFRLINTRTGELVGDFAAIADAWEAVTKNKGRMVLWEQWEAHAGWMWRQRALKFIPWQDRAMFAVRQWWKLRFGDKKRAGV